MIRQGATWPAKLGPQPDGERYPTFVIQSQRSRCLSTPSSSSYVPYGNPIAARNSIFTVSLEIRGLFF
jgi:hypothetical protein